MLLLGTSKNTMVLVQRHENTMDAFYCNAFLSYSYTMVFTWYTKNTMVLPWYLSKKHENTMVLWWMIW